MKVFVITLSLLVSSLTMAQETITISGKVVDLETDEGLIGAHIYSIRNWRNGSTAGVDGSFRLTEISVKDSIIVSFVGFKELVLPVKKTMTIALEPLKIKGEEVVVSSKRLIAEEFKYMKLNKLDIYTNPQAKADPILAINSLPSSTTTDESANISLRGSSPIETNIFLNNVPIYDAVRYSQLNGIGTFSIFNTSIVKDVVVFPGNPPLEFGNSTAGVISLTTDESILDGNANSVIVSLANIGITREQKISDNQSLKVFSNWQPSGAIKAVNETSLESIKSFKSGDLGIYWYGFTSKLNWKVLNYSVSEAYEFNFEHPSFEGVFDQKKRRSFIISTAQIPLGTGNLNVNNALSSSTGNYGYSNVTFRVIQQDLFGSINYQLEHKTFGMKTGISYDWRISKVNGNFHEFSYALGPTHPTETFNELAKSKLAEGYVYAKYYVSDVVTAGGGIRKNLPQDEQRNYVSGQFNLAYLNDPWNITIGVGSYNKYGLIENTGEPFNSTSDQASLDIKYETEQFKSALSLFTKQNQLNSNGYESKGVELFLDYRFSSKVQASGSFTWLDAKSDADEIYQYDINYFVRGNLTYTPGRLWTIESILLTREGIPFDVIEGASFDDQLGVFEPIESNEVTRLAGYFNLSTSVSKVFPVSDKINIIGFASINNIFDVKNTRTLIYNFDYTAASDSYFSRRTTYFGMLISF